MEALSLSSLLNTALMHRTHDQDFRTMVIFYQSIYHFGVPIGYGAGIATCKQMFTPSTLEECECVKDGRLLSRVSTWCAIGSARGTSTLKGDNAASGNVGGPHSARDDSVTALCR
ncbi:hypothetical protein HAX54_048625 [Datura stramonium]|uniref:Uncharacterized protein n=1 Tax=Datura stramonium TaxID=4076 RepID=A0ABS8WLK7_DATST|nr:hypothetical protein [Datura stramonium]